jgi:membrane protease YdiL (CAAX protease family)
MNSAPDSPDGALASDDDVPVAAAAPRFCGTCGTPWQPHWTQCEPCAAVAVQRLGQPVADAEHNGIFRIRSALALYFTLLAVSVVAFFAGLAEAPEVTVDLASSVAFAVIVTLWCGFSSPRSVIRLFKPARLHWFALAAVGGVCTFALAFAVIETMHRALGMEKLSYSQPYLDAGYGLWVVVVTVCVQPAVFEELAFRGVMLTSLRPTLSNVEAVLVTAMLFMTLHISPAAFPHTLAMGVAAGFMRLASGSILPCMLMHFVHNSICIFAEVYWGI